MYMTVERVSYLHEHEIDEFMKAIKHAFRPDDQDDVQIIRDAVAIVRKGVQIEYKSANDGRRIDATFIEADHVTVQLYPLKQDAMCTCIHPGWCVHKVAVIFHLYSQFNSLTEWLHDWQRREIEQMVLTISERTPEAWNDVLDRLTKPLYKLAPGENPNVFIHETSLMDQKVIPLYPFEWEWKPLFELFYRLHLVEAAWPYLQGHLEGVKHLSYREWQVKMWLTEQIDKINDQVQSLSNKLRLFETDAFYKSLEENVRRFILNSDGLFESRLDIYSSVSELLYVDPATQKKELAFLLETDDVDAPFFAAYFHLTQGDVQALAEVAEKVGGELVDHWLPLADFATDLDEMESLRIIMETIYPHIGAYFHEISMSTDKYHFIRLIDGLLEIADFTEARREELFMVYGESGVSTFGDFLIERERFSEWAALMHRYDIPYDGIESDTMRFVLSNDPAAVMPLLHVYAMRFIQEKNRHSYRRAVRLFKNMKTGAKKSGKIEFWNNYIDTVREQFRRLRALAEEMEKGNLNL
ncbi:hypothetical protein QWT69_02575 [Sporosarcina oncorhynchi]|uniref:SWIM-type domain-containing protein n=1 Tax=Sporosarcina oncorhynchi TaxID=3056444 RepID=A0ABZ0L9A0_9BACL|nr:hypothetical protein [Sporosarcina sp. T2O-4]WOV88024.1 hypothetical protein QWT69_02575 [Sporosarcina sp. T2O-4]